MSLQCVRSSRSQSSDGGVSPYQSPPPYGLGSDGEGVSSPLLYSGSSGSGLNYSVSPVQYTGSDQDDSAYHEPLYYSESSPGAHDSGVYHVNSSEYKFQCSELVRSEDVEIDLKSSSSKKEVACVQAGSGCSWVGQLGRLQTHLATCSKDSVQCQLNCGVKVARVSIADHMQYTCQNRSVHCMYCRGRFTGSSIEAHERTCGFEPVPCSNHCGMRVTRNRLMSHLSSVCSKRQVCCRYCSVFLSSEQLQNHQLRCSEYPVSCPNRCGAELPRRHVGFHVEACSQDLLTCMYRSAGCVWRGSEQELVLHAANSTQHHLNLLSNQCRVQAELLKNLRLELDEANTAKDGILVWKISDFWRKMEEGRMTEGLELVSLPFFTSQNGYKMQVSLFPYGNGGGEGTHMSVYIKVLPGPSDAILKWPFKHTVSFTLLDQTPERRSAVNIVESFIPDPTWENFKRASKRTDPDQLGFGFPRFVAHSVLQTRNYVKENVMFIRVRADPSQSVKV